MKRLEKPNWQKRRERKGKFWPGLFIALLLLSLAAGGYLGGKNLFSSGQIEASGSTIYVKSGGDLQAAFDRAKPGDTIVLEAGAAYTGSFTQPAKSGAEFITVQSSALAELPADGARVGPKDATRMPKILSAGRGEPAIKTAPGAHHYRFVGTEFAPANSDYIYNLVYLGAPTR